LRKAQRNRGKSLPAKKKSNSATPKKKQNEGPRGKAPPLSNGAQKNDDALFFVGKGRIRLSVSRTKKKGK